MSPGPLLLGFLLVGVECSLSVDAGARRVGGADEVVARVVGGGVDGRAAGGRDKTIGPGSGRGIVAEEKASETNNDEEEARDDEGETPGDTCRVRVVGEERVEDGRHLRRAEG